MQVVELSSKHHELGVAIASLSLNQLVLTALVKNGLLSKDEALGRLRAMVITNMRVPLPANRAAAAILERMLGEVQDLEIPAAAH